ncbi:MAG: hypothetical protein H7Y36_00055 [Armatimonadetes bacterium]|nr:hypothetical protein [Akkermansiaceae bacterium]
MARRASSSTNPTLIVGIALVIVAAIFGGKFLMTKKSTSFSDVTPLAIQDLMDNGNSLRGNEYLIEGKIDEKLRWTASNGQIISLRVKSAGGEEIIPVQIPDKFNRLNIEREQRYAFKVEFEQGGIPVVTAVNRL